VTDKDQPPLHPRGWKGASGRTGRKVRFLLWALLAGISVLVTLIATFLRLFANSPLSWSGLLVRALLTALVGRFAWSARRRSRSPEARLSPWRHVVTACLVVALVLVVATSGTRSAQPPVLGGVTTTYAAFPSLAYVLYLFHGEPAFQCTGTVIAPRLVLTAGHCTGRRGQPRDPPGSYRVTVGDVESTRGARQTLGVSRVIVFPGFNRGGSSRISPDDAALLVLSAPTSVPPIRLGGEPTAGPAPGTRAEIVGWATTAVQRASPKRRVRAPTVVQSERWCRSELRPEPFYPRGEICTANPPANNTTSCAGDSGGPLVADAGASGTGVEIGVASGGFETNNRCIPPSVWTPTAVIARWVDGWIGASRSWRVAASR
jgi:Trypsin